MLIFGCVFVFISVFLLALSRLSKPSGIALHDEWRETVVNKNKSTRKRNLIIGLVIALAAAYLVTGKIVISLIAGVIGSYFVAGWLTNRAEAKRKQILTEQYTQVLNSIVSSLQGGSNPYQALEGTITNLKNPARGIFLEVIRNNRTGTNYSEAVQKAAEDNDWEELYQVAMALRLYDRSGSNLVKVFNHLLQSAYAHQESKQYVDGITATIRASMTVIGAIPFVLIALMRLMAPDFIAPLFNTWTGMGILAYTVISVFAGFKISNKVIGNVIGG